eukprot:353000-Chlamydomonas_euryale.AAC.23
MHAMLLPRQHTEAHPASTRHVNVIPIKLRNSSFVILLRAKGLGRKGKEGQGRAKKGICSPARAAVFQGRPSLHTMASTLGCA